VSWLTDDSSKQRYCCFKRWRERLLLFPSPLLFHFSFSSFIVKWFPYLYSLLSPVYFSLKPSPVSNSSSFLSLSLSLSLSLCFPFLFLSFLLFFSPPPLLLALSGIYKAKGSGDVPIAALPCP